MGLELGKEYSFSTLESDGRKYICIDCGPADDSLERALEIVKQNGFRIEKENDSESVLN